MAIRDWPIDERPREKLLEKGAAALSDAEILAILLRTGTPGRSALDLARDALAAFGSLRQLIAADRGRFCAAAGLGLARYARTPGGGRDIAPTTVAVAARRPLACESEGDPRLPERSIARPRARSVLLPLSRQAPSPDPVRGAVPRHDRRRERASAGDRKARAAKERGRGDRRSQSPVMLRCSVTTRVRCHSSSRNPCGPSTALAR